MTFKFETILDGLSYNLFYLSSLEIVFFFFNIVFFVWNVSAALWYAILFLIFHMARAALGFYICHMIPPSHEITRKIGYQGDQQLKFA